MVMEAATLSGPQRKCNVAPVQKSLSLPSYARVGGEGIDHRLIFAALEQKEKVRRKSKIFTREKTARQNIFCLPISTGSKCRETSLSSDTSCSSLEYQKPKPVAKPKKEESKSVTKTVENDPPSNEYKTVKTSQFESKSNSECVRKNILSRNIVNGNSEQNHSLLKGHRSPVDTYRLNVGSSDSMERSSRSSNDSLTRKERLVAIKARVEAEREKYGNSSSEEEELRSNMTRYNSDGVIHRTVREVKSRSYRHDKKLRRRSQGEWAVKKVDRKNNLSLCLNPEDDGIKLHLEKLDRLNTEISNLEVKTDYCPSPSFPDVTKKSYFSDFPSRENVTKFVQQRIRHIEEEERKRRSGSDFFDKIKLSPRVSPLLQEKSTYASAEHVNHYEKKPLSSSYISDVRTANSELVMCASPVPKTTQAPTPPPRSPKSITFVNKAFLQHQNTTLLHQENSLDKKNFFQPNITAVTQTRPSDKFNPKADVITRDSKNSLLLQGTPAEKQQMRDLFSARRKTCGHFDFVDEKILNDLCSSLGTVSSSNIAQNNNSNQSSSLTQLKSIDNKGYVSNAEASSSVAGNRNKWGFNKWEESERRREFMFNSLESKKKSNVPFGKKKISAGNIDTCICFLAPGNKMICECKKFEKTGENKNIEHNYQPTNFDAFPKKILPHGSSLETSQMLSKNADTCICFLAPGNKMTCECKNRETTFKSMNTEQDSFQSADFESLPKKTASYGSSRDNWKTSNDIYIRSADLQKNQVIFPKDKLNGENKYSHNKLTTHIDFSHTGDKTTSFNFKSSNNNVNCPASDTSATANLESAMAELESVYLSLKFSSDNLSDRNSLSNLSLSDEDSKIYNKDCKDLHVNTDSLVKRTSVHESNSCFNSPISSNVNSDSNKLLLFNDYLKPVSYNREKDIFVPTEDTTIAKNVSINELFKDLTPQLNTLEQKFESCNSRHQQPVSCQQINRFDDKPHNNPSSIGFKKEFYENLNQQQGNFQRKKYKAVRSLSENISQLMNSPNNNNRVISRNLSESNSQPVNNSTLTSVNDSASDCYKAVKQDSWKIESKQELASNPSRLGNRINDSDRAFNPKHEEIRHIRVSMDSTASQSSQTSTNPCPETNKYSRLSSAVYSPQMSPKCEVSKPFQFNSCSSSKENIDKTIDGLEELLNSLLVDVPESNQSSLSKAKDAVPTSTPSPISTGEMSVLQHLDVIRLKPVPS